jgi:hypothetical protein
MKKFGMSKKKVGWSVKPEQAILCIPWSAGGEGGGGGGGDIQGFVSWDNFWVRVIVLFI